MGRKILTAIKSIIIVMMFIFLLTVIRTHGECQEVFMKLDAINHTKTVSKTEKVTDEKKEKTAKKSAQNRQVKIVIKTSDYSSIYHPKVTMKSSRLTIYSGKKYAKKTSCKKRTISSTDSFFKKSNIIKVEAESAIQWKNHQAESTYTAYRGMFYIYKTKKGLVVVNQLDLEDYVAGVISSEMGENSPLEALKAQAVCARTYILKRKKEKYKKYDALADDSTDFQVYNRLAPGKNSIKAAKETKNIVMTYQNKPINAYYFSTSCGYTTNDKIWGKDRMAYLNGGVFVEKEEQVENHKVFETFIKSASKGIESKYPYYRWNIYLTKEQIENGIYRTIGVSTGKVSRIEINSRGKGGIVSNITIYGKHRQVVIKNQNQIRKALCSSYATLTLNDGTTKSGMTMLPSAFFAIEPVYHKKEITGFNLKGGGFGHGSGMSQNGAEEMAREGKDYQTILNAYYSEIKIDVY